MVCCMHMHPTSLCAAAHEPAAVTWQAHQIQLSAPSSVLHDWQSNVPCTALLWGMKTDLQLLHCSPSHPQLSGCGTAAVGAAACGTNRRACGLCR